MNGPCCIKVCGGSGISGISQFRAKKGTCGIRGISLCRLEEPLLALDGFLARGTESGLMREERRSPFKSSVDPANEERVGEGVIPEIEPDEDARLGL
jgi:hypothetical protein